MKRHVVVGGGPAGIFAVETIRDLAPQDDITLISDEPAYSRMVLPYLMAGEIPEDQVFTGKGRYFEALRVKTVLERVSRVDPKRKTLTLAPTNFSAELRSATPARVSTHSPPPTWRWPISTSRVDPSRGWRSTRWTCSRASDAGSKVRTTSCPFSPLARAM